ncbi:MAG: hypothetical protein TREMPRED_004202 [Tremellales sp. Tagirdzhanova-0007]|nr:MAG: hypothetical protein TREMPRED_004202 [Tremellales sp. Tagirdzhanova-0007]
MAPLPIENNTITFAERPSRGPISSTTFRQQRSPIQPLQDGQVLVQIDYISIDPTMRIWLNGARSYLEPIKIGAVMRAAGIGRVVDSRSRMTAYFGVFDIGRLKDSETIVVSGAAGSVGLVNLALPTVSPLLFPLIVAQIALSLSKCTVVAIAGSSEKCASLEALGCQVVLNYKDHDFKKSLRKVGLVDVFFDNVGGEILDIVLGQLKPYARVVACGAISAYNAERSYGVRNTPNLVAMKAKIEGFIVLDYARRYPEARAYLADLRNKGKIMYEYTVLGPEDGKSGLERCVEGLEAVLAGRNFGKTLIKVSEEERESKL